MERELTSQRTESDLVRNLVDLTLDSSDDEEEDLHGGDGCLGSSKGRQEESAPWLNIVQETREELLRIARAAQSRAIHNVPTPIDDQDIASYPELLQALGLEEIDTRSNGNCQYVSLVQALLQRRFGAGTVDSITMSECLHKLKVGEHAAAMANFDAQFPHFVRAQMLQQFGRYEDGMSADETAAALRKYFHDVASSTNDICIEIPRCTWGGSDTLCMAAMLLNLPIFEVAQPDEETSPLLYSIFRPTTKTTGMGEAVPTGGEFPVDSATWVRELQHSQLLASATTRSLQPLVIRHCKQHYSSLIFTENHRE